MPRLVHIEQGHRAAFTRPYGLVVASCDKRADGRLWRRIMPPVARLKVAKAVHQSAPSRPCALVPHRFTRSHEPVVVACDKRAR